MKIELVEKTFPIRPTPASHWMSEYNGNWILPYSAMGEGEFPVSEWDGTLVLTKKRPVLEVGGTCRFPGPSTQMVIIGFDDKHVWLKDPQNMGATGFLIDIDTISDVKPWQPA